MVSGCVGKWVCKWVRGCTANGPRPSNLFGFFLAGSRPIPQAPHASQPPHALRPAVHTHLVATQAQQLLALLGQQPPHALHIVR